VSAATDGCTGCGTQATATIDGFHGRRCRACAPDFDPATAVRLMVDGWPGAAVAYVRTWAA
jgi:hypothetical protein